MNLLKVENISLRAVFNEMHCFQILLYLFYLYHLGNAIYGLILTITYLVVFNQSSYDKFVICIFKFVYIFKDVNFF